jgi:hypothetical protein
VTSGRPSEVPRVGIATHEALLTAAVVQRPDAVLSDPPTDHARVVLQEVELGIGRPDLIVLNVDLTTMALRKVAGLRLSNLTEARALGALLYGDPTLSGVSTRHLRKLADRLSGAGWLDPQVSSRAVSDSILIEAKVSHWGKGVGQLARVRWASHSAALLVPTDVARRVPAAMLNFNGLGLLTQDDGTIAWHKASPRADLPLHIDAWLGELAMRALEG